MADEKNKKNPALPNSFTVDNINDVAQEMPSIGRLLNRKAFGAKVSKHRTSPSIATPVPEESGSVSLPDIWNLETAVSKNGPQKKEAAGMTPQRNPTSRAGFDEPAVEVDRTLANLFRPKAEPDPSEEPTEGGAERTRPQHPAVKRAITQPGNSRGRTKNSPLIIWEKSQLLASRDPLGRALGDLLSRGVEAALFLTIQAPLPGTTVPCFLGSAVVAVVQRRALWTGLKWDPTLSPELWNQFVKTGRVELMPPSATTTRNAVRAAFGVDRDYWLTLVRVGPAHACRGVLALVSRNSVKVAVDGLQTLLNSLPDLKAA